MTLNARHLNVGIWFFLSCFSRKELKWLLINHKTNLSLGMPEEKLAGRPSQFKENRLWLHSLNFLVKIKLYNMFWRVNETVPWGQHKEKESHFLFNLFQLACVLGQFLNNFCMFNEQKCKWNFWFPTHADIRLPGSLP